MNNNLICVVTNANNKKLCTWWQYNHSKNVTICVLEKYIKTRNDK